MSQTLLLLARAADLLGEFQAWQGVPEGTAALLREWFAEYEPVAGMPDVVTPEFPDQLSLPRRAALLVWAQYETEHPGNMPILRQYAADVIRYEAKLTAAERRL